MHVLIALSSIINILLNRNWFRESKHKRNIFIKYSFEVDLYSLPKILWVVKSRRMRWAGNVALMGEGRGVRRVLVGKPEGKRPLGRPRRRWDDNIKMDLQEVGRGCGDWMKLAQDRDRWRALVCTVRNLRVPQMRGIS